MSVPCPPTIHSPGDLREAATPAGPARPLASRLLAPSLTDLFFLCVLVTSFMLTEMGWQRLLMDGDTAVHIRIGDYILQQGAVPHADPFSFTRQGHPWIAWEWLAGILYALLNTHLGLKGVVFFSGVLIAAAVTAVLRNCLKAGGNSIIAFALVLLGGNALSIHYHARPHLFTLLFLAIAAGLIDSDRRARTRWIWCLVPLTVLWTNLHAGFFILFAVLGIYAAGDLISMALGEGAERQRAREGVRRSALLGFACAAASLLNPYGYKLHHQILGYLSDSSIRNTVHEFQAPAFRSEAEMCFMALLFAGLSAAGLLLSRRRFPEALLLLFLAYSALTSIRHMTVFAVAGGPIIAVELTVWWRRWTTGKARSSIAGILEEVSQTLTRRLRPLSLWPAAALAGIFFLVPAAHWPSDFSNRLFPVEIARRNSAELARSRVFTTDQWADYLLYQNPAQRVFFDDRCFFGDEIVNDALNLMNGAPEWKQLLEKYSIDAVLCPSRTALASLLRTDPGWMIADDDGGKILFRAKPI